MLRSGELWFSNPLHMNDLEELRFGIHAVTEYFQYSESIRRALTPTNYTILEQKLRERFNDFNKRGAFDVYVFCGSEHDDDEDDGLLSMWRGYGAGGKGVAIIFDLSKLDVVPGSPIVLGPVDYLTRNEREQWIIGFFERFAALLQGMDLNEDDMTVAAHYFFHRACQFALFSKHRGFREEREWRAVYIADNDTKDVYRDRIDVVHDGKGGVAPKFKFRPIAGTGDLPNVELVDFVKKIILGPSLSEPLNAMAATRLLMKANPRLQAPIVSSTTPFRSQSQ